MISEAHESLFWPHTEGIITTSHMDSDYRPSGGRLWYINIRYEFKVNGVKYSGFQISLKNPDIPDNEILRLNPVGKEVTIYYDPKDPTYCILEPGI